MKTGCIFLAAAAVELVAGTDATWWHLGQVFVVLLFALAVGFVAYSAGREDQ